MPRRSAKDIQELSAISIKDIEVEMSNNLEGNAMNESEISRMNQTQEVVAFKTDSENSVSEGQIDKEQKTA